MKFIFKPHIIDTSLEGKHWGQTALADIDNCGRCLLRYAGFAAGGEGQDYCEKGETRVMHG